MSSRRPFSIQELAARSRPTGYDASKSLKDLLRIATAERNAGDQAKDAGDVESAFIHYAKASTLMLEDLPTHPKFAELTSSQKDAVVVHGQAILDSLGAVKRLVSQRFSDWRTEHPDADLSAPVVQPQQPRRRQTQPTHQPRDTYEEARRAQQQKEARRLVEEQERRQRRAARDAGAYDQVAALTTRRDATAAPYDQVANITAARIREKARRAQQQKEPAALVESKNAANDGPRATQEPTTKSPPSPLAAMPLPPYQVANITAARIREKQDNRLEKEKLEELKRAQEARFWDTLLRSRSVPGPDSYRARLRPSRSNPNRHRLSHRSRPRLCRFRNHSTCARAATHWKRRTSVPFSPPDHPTADPTTDPDGSRAEVHRPGSRAEHRPSRPRTDLWRAKRECARCL
ncbi:hypothetical protein RhiLY_12601 [Ceratobasidium sp. AG-Ba]|nr:hypothetical protein RhiLY_12601 [Ceratobasidium sp. AG-Ba]